MDYRKVGFWQLMSLVVLLTFAVQFIHEAGHAVIFLLLGKGPTWGVNSLAQIWGELPLRPENWLEYTAPDGEQGWLRMASMPNPIEFAIALFAGPLASLLAVTFGLGLAHFKKNPATRQIGLALALVTSLPLIQYYLRSTWRATGDEYYIALYLDIPKYALDAPFGLLFLLGLIMALYWLGDWKTRLKWLGITTLGSMPVGLFIMFVNGWVISQINQENPIFQPLFGFALPVLAFNVLVFALLWAWRRYSAQQQPILDG